MIPTPARPARSTDPTSLWPGAERRCGVQTRAPDGRETQTRLGQTTSPAPFWACALSAAASLF